MTELWNWRMDRRIPAAEVYPALAAALGRVVMPLGAADPDRTPEGAVIADVWHAPGDFPTVVDCYGVPDGVSEQAAVAALARGSGRHCLLPDDTLDAGRHLLVAPDGTVRPVHFDVRDTDEGEVLSNRRPCTVHNPGCRGWSQCQRSRWAPDSVVPVLAAA